MSHAQPLVITLPGDKQLWAHRAANRSVKQLLELADGPVDGAEMLRLAAHQLLRVAAAVDPILGEVYVEP